MRTTNFVRPRARRPALWSLAFWVIGASTLAAAGLMTLESQRLQRVTERLEAGLVDAPPAPEATDAAIPTSREVADLAGRIAFFNRIVGDRRSEPLEVLAALEAALPAEVWVSTLQYDVATGALTMSLLSSDESRLPEALQRVEGLDLLRSVILERQVRVRQGERTLVQYDIRGEAG